MPTKVCPVCNRLQVISRQEWTYVSPLPQAVCSKACILRWISDQTKEPGYLVPALRLAPSTADEIFSLRLAMGFRSKFELLVAEWLVENDIPFEYERWAYKVKTTMWTPDFHLPLHNCFLEVKGKWGVSAHKKISNFQKTYPTINLLIVPWIVRREFYE